MFSERGGQRKAGGAGRQRAIVGPVAVRVRTFELVQQKPKTLERGLLPLGERQPNLDENTPPPLPQGSGPPAHVTMVPGRHLP